MPSILKRIPGFRTGKKIKMIIASIYYIFAISMWTEGFGYFLFSLTAPFMIFNFIDLFKNKKKSISFKKAALNFLISFALIIVSMVAVPDTLPSDVSQNEQEIEVNEVIKNIAEAKSEELAKAPEPIVAVIEKPTEVVKVEVSEEKVEESQETIKTNGILEVHFIDVGQADASLLICDDKAMLIDGGKSKDSSLIYTYLKNRGIDRLDYIVSTHPHEDHVGGLAGALNYATVSDAYSPVTSYESRAFNSFVKYLNEQNVSITVPSAGDKFNLGSATIHVLGPVYYSNNDNNNSIVLKVVYGNTSFIFTGDAEREEEQDILAQGYELSSTVLKVGHHGSDTSTTYPFLREIMPDYAVISVGSNNQYGHPNGNTLSRLRDADVKVLRTDMQGDIIFTSDGTNVSFTVERNINADTLANTSKPTQLSNTNSEPTPSDTVEEKANTTEINYILNTNTKKFHYPRCSSVKKMSEKNKKETNLHREEVISQSYDPCGNCKP